MELACEGMVHHASPILLYLIVIGYFVFAIQVAVQVNWIYVHRPYLVALGSLIAVFVFCALSGYASTLMVDSATTRNIREAFHVILACATWSMVLTNQPREIAHMVELRTKSAEPAS